MADYLYEKADFTVAVDEADYFGRLKPSAIMQYMQDVATSHAETLKVGFARMMDEGLAWVISRMSVKMDKYPSIGDKVSVYTFPKNPGVVDAVRDFYICNEFDEQIGRATSKWCVLDFHAKTIKKVAPLFHFDVGSYIATDAIADGNGRIDIPESMQEVYQSSVRTSDLDRNLHMNNSRYGDLVFDALEWSTLSYNNIESFDFNFLKELKRGQAYGVYRADSPLESIVKISTDGADHCVCRVKFNKRG